QGWTALMHCAKVGRSDMADLLICAGGSCSQRDAEGRTASDIAKQAGNHELSQSLLPAARNKKKESMRRASLALDAASVLRARRGSASSSMGKSAFLGVRLENLPSDMEQEELAKWLAGKKGIRFTECKVLACPITLKPRGFAFVRAADMTGVAQLMDLQGASLRDLGGSRRLRVIRDSGAPCGTSTWTMDDLPSLKSLAIGTAVRSIMTAELMALDVPLLRHILDFLLFDLADVEPPDSDQRPVTMKIASVFDDDNAEARRPYRPPGIALANRRLSCLALGCAVRRQRELEDMRSREAWQRAGDLLKRYKLALEEIIEVARDSPFGIVLEGREEFADVFHRSPELQLAYLLRSRGKALSELLDGMFHHLSPLVAIWAQTDEDCKELELFFNNGTIGGCSLIADLSRPMTTPGLDNRTRITSVSIDHGALGLIPENPLKSRLASSLSLLARGRLPYALCASVVVAAVACAYQKINSLRQQTSTLAIQLEEAHSKLAERESELQRKTEELRLLSKRWHSAARMLLSRAILNGKMQEAEIRPTSELERSVPSRGVASRLVAAATNSGATKVAAAAAMMWMLRLRVSAGGSVQLRGGPHIKAKFGVSRPS
ncbi:hypothetical protein FOZ63_029753, partial [Perkinsus olseni]